MYIVRRPVSLFITAQGAQNKHKSSHQHKHHMQKWIMLIRYYPVRIRKTTPCLGAAARAFGVVYRACATKRLWHTRDKKAKGTPHHAQGGPCLTHRLKKHEPPYFVPACHTLAIPKAFQSAEAKVPVIISRRIESLLKMGSRCFEYHLKHDYMVGHGRATGTVSIEAIEHKDLVCCPCLRQRLIPSQMLAYFACQPAELPVFINVE